MSGLVSEIDEVARRTGFSGVITLDADGQPTVAAAYGLADRRHRIPNTVDTQFGTASGTKSLTALTVMSLVADGALSLDTTARSLLRDDLPLIAGDVTVEHLLTHRSGIGDYLDENVDHDPLGYTVTAPQQLDCTQRYLAELEGHPTKFPAGEDFAYCNGGYVVLALLAERASGTLFAELVEQRVCRPAGMADTRFLRSDALPQRAAVGYLHPDGLRTNVLHLPVVGTGDGGIYTTTADVLSLWTALHDGRILPDEQVADVMRPRSTDPSDGYRYGLGFWIHPTRDDVAVVSGGDVGVSFCSFHDSTAGITATVVSNVTGGTGPLVELIEERLFG